MTWNLVSIVNTPDRRQKRTPQTIEEPCAIVLSATVGKSVYLLFFIYYSLILVKLESPSYCKMKCGLLYTIVVSSFQLLKT